MFATLTASRIFSKYYPNANLWLVIITMTFLVLIFGEVTPKSLAIKIGGSISMLVSPIWYFMQILLTPFIFIFKGIVKVLMYFASTLLFFNVKEPDMYKADEVIEVIKESQKHGIIGKEESTMLGNVIEFVDTNIWELMRPRNQIFSLSADTIIGDVIEKIKDNKYSRIPVWEDEEENIIGILCIKDLININGIKRKLGYYRNILKAVFCS